VFYEANSTSLRKRMLGQKFASDTEMQSVIRHSAGTAADIVLCIRHSETCLKIKQKFEQTWTTR